MLLIGLLYMACSACFLIYPSNTCQGMAPPTMGWAFPYQPLSKKVSHRLAIFSFEVPSSQIILACAKLIHRKKQKQNKQKCNHNTHSYKTLLLWGLLICESGDMFLSGFFFFFVVSGVIALECVYTWHYWVACFVLFYF